MANEAMGRLAHLIEPAPDLTPNDNLRRAVELMEFGLSLKAAQLSRQYPEATAEELEERYLHWLTHRPEAPFGDFPGPVRQL